MTDCLNSSCADCRVTADWVWLQVVKAGLPTAVVTFSPQARLIKEVLRAAIGDELTRNIVIIDSKQAVSQPRATGTNRNTQGLVPTCYTAHCGVLHRYIRDYKHLKSTVRGTDASWLGREISSATGRSHI